MLFSFSSVLKNVRKKNALSLEEKLYTCCYLENGDTNNNLAKELKLNYFTILIISKNRDLIKKLVEENSLKTKKISSFHIRKS